MPNYELRPRLSLLTLTVEEGDCWEDQLVFVGTDKQWNSVRVLEDHLSLTYDGKYCG